MQSSSYANASENNAASNHISANVGDGSKTGENSNQGSETQVSISNPLLLHWINFALHGMAWKVNSCSFWNNLSNFLEGQKFCALDRHNSHCDLKALRIYLVAWLHLSQTCMGIGTLEVAEDSTIERVCNDHLFCCLWIFSEAYLNYYMLYAENLGVEEFCLFS